MKARSRFVGIVMVVVVALLLILSLSAQAQSGAVGQAQPAAQAASGVVSKSMSEAEQAATLRYWTRETLAAAQPLAAPIDRGPSGVVTSQLGQMAVTAPPGYSMGGLPDADADRAARRAYPADWSAREEAAIQDAVAAQLAEAAPLAPEGTSQVYTSYIVNQLAPLWKQYPYRTIGRLSFSTSGGTSYCSASNVSGNSIIVTAAHCLYDSTNNVWYSNWAFSPAFRNTASPYGVFPAQTCWVLTTWVNLTGNYNINGWAPYDVGVCKMNNNSAGRPLSAAVGWLGRQWNFPYVVHVHNNGYPFRDYNNALITNAGKYLHSCVAETFQQAAEVLGAGCNRGPGISGGPWVAKLAPFVVTGWVDSVNSGLFIGTQNLYGARFNSNNIVVLCNAAGC